MLVKEVLDGRYCENKFETQGITLFCLEIVLILMYINEKKYLLC